MLLLRIAEHELVAEATPFEHYLPCVDIKEDVLAGTLLHLALNFLLLFTIRLVIAEFEVAKIGSRSIRLGVGRDRFTKLLINFVEFLVVFLVFFLVFNRFLNLFQLVGNTQFVIELLLQASFLVLIPVN